MINKKSVGLYIHIPFCKQKCIYCDFAAYQNIESYEDVYIDSLVRELQYYYNEAEKVKLHTIYFGGGTPTHLKMSSIEKIVNAIDMYFDRRHIVEMNIESNPGEVDKSYYSSLVNLGFSRISFGVQTLDNSLLILLHRTHTDKEAYYSVEDAYQAGFHHIGADFIYGLPNQSIKTIEKTLDFLDNSYIDHVSIYGLQLETSTYLYSLAKKGQIALPDDDLKEAMYDKIIDSCQHKGFERYEISNFAKNRAYGLHNLTYWQGKEYIGVGAGAHSYFNSIRYGNTPYIVPYINGMKENKLPIVEHQKLTIHEKKEEYCFLHLRTKWGINPNEYEKQFNVSFLEEYGTIVERIIGQNLMRKTADNHYVLTDLGEKYGNYVFQAFIKDNYK